MTQGKRKPAKAAPRRSEAAPRKNAKARAAAGAEARATRARKSTPKKRTASQPARAIRQARKSVRAATNVAAEKLVGARDAAVEAVSETAGEVGSRARRVAAATAGFLSANAVPLALLGLGTGWLALAVQRRRRVHQAVMNSVAPPPASASTEGASQLLDRSRERLAALGDRALELGHDARDGLVAAEQRTREFAKEHPLAASAMAVAAGVGIGMALPDSKIENTVLGSARGKLAEDAKALFNEAKSGVQSALDAAADVKDRLVAGVR